MFTVTNPANGKVIGSVPDMNDEDVNQAIETAYKTFHTWKKTSAKVLQLPFGTIKCIFRWLFR